MPVLLSAESLIFEATKCTKIMKRFLFILTSFVMYGTLTMAQSEMAADTLSRPTGDVPPAGTEYLSGEVKSYDGFLLDMKSLLKTPAPDFSQFKLTVPNVSKDYNAIVRPNTDAIYTSGLSNMFSSSFYLNPFGLTGFGSPMDNLQMGSFKLKNGWRLNTYGEYDKDGWRVPNPSALPWEKNNFKGAFELKSQDGSFGIRIEVQQGRQRPF